MGRTVLTIIDIVKYQYRITPPEEALTMFPSPELVALIQQERERSIARDRLARLAACVRACCAPSLVGRVVRTVRRSPAAC
jgi:hypothetical protein